MRWKSSLKATSLLNTYWLTSSSYVVERTEESQILKLACYLSSALSPFNSLSPWTRQKRNCFSQRVGRLQKSSSSITSQIVPRSKDLLPKKLIILRVLETDPTTKWKSVSLIHATKLLQRAQTFCLQFDLSKLQTPNQPPGLMIQPSSFRRRPLSKKKRRSAQWALSATNCPSEYQVTVSADQKSKAFCLLKALMKVSAESLYLKSFLRNQYQVASGLNNFYSANNANSSLPYSSLTLALPFFPYRLTLTSSPYRLILSAPPSSSWPIHLLSTHSWLSARNCSRCQRCRKQKRRWLQEERERCRESEAQWGKDLERRRSAGREGS